MTDIELLELAAKAAGLNLAEYREERNSMYFPFPSELTDGHWWNPLTDDGDALRLAVSLALWGDKDFIAEIQSIITYPGDNYAATRRAIVRAAAEIGKAMK